jgi:hypothetical protein
MVSALVVGTAGEMPAISWARCRRAPLPGDAINPDCLEMGPNVFLEEIGEGMTITATMPADVTPADLGAPDATGGVYLPLVARVTVDRQTLIATYRLRLGSASDLNQNPALTGLLVMDASGNNVPLDPATPLVVHPGDRLTLTTVITPDSLQTFPGPLGGEPTVEVLTTSWFSTRGTFTKQRSDGLQATNVLQLDDDLRAPGSIDLFAVTRDDRGGTDYVQRTLSSE